MTSLSLDNPSLARAYDRLSDSQFAGGQRLVGRFALNPGDRVLDVGCGTGRLASFIAGIVGPGQVVGIDPLVERVNVAKAQHPSLSFAVGQAEDLSAFADASFDAVCMSAVFHWVQDKPRALREVRRVLRPGGRFGLTTPARELRGSSTTSRICSVLLGEERYSRSINPAGLATMAQLGMTLSDLVAMVAQVPLELLELHTVRRTQSFARGDDAVEFLQSSSFGNFLRLVTDDAAPTFRADLVAAFDARKGPEGILVHDHGTLLVAERS